jgi:hypothetical protein
VVIVAEHVEFRSKAKDGGGQETPEQGAAFDSSDVPF